MLETTIQTCALCHIYRVGSWCCALRAASHLYALPLYLECADAANIPSAEIGSSLAQLIMAGNEKLRLVP